jgi:membrane associated rhomboid family serine protease
MWIILGIIAILATGTNVYMYKTGKDYKLAMAIGLSFTALTLCAEYSLVSKWVKVKDMSALLDVVPTMEMALWVLTIISVILNIAPVFLDFKN